MQIIFKQLHYGTENAFIVKTLFKYIFYFPPEIQMIRISNRLI